MTAEIPLIPFPQCSLHESLVGFLIELVVLLRNATSTPPNTLAQGLVHL